MKFKGSLWGEVFEKLKTSKEVLRFHNESAGNRMLLNAATLRFLMRKINRRLYEGRPKRLGLWIPIESLHTMTLMESLRWNPPMKNLHWRFSNSELSWESCVSLREDKINKIPFTPLTIFAACCCLLTSCHRVCQGKESLVEFEESVLSC